MAAPIFVNAGSKDSTPIGTSVTPPLPSSRVTGHMLIAFVLGGGGGTPTTFTFPGGWTVIDSYASTGESGAYAFRYVDGTETAPLITLSRSTSAVAVVCQYSGEFAGAPIGAFSQAHGTSNPITGGSLTTTGDNSLVVAAIFDSSTFVTIAYPSGYNGETTDGTTGGTFNISDVAVATAGSTSPAISENASSSQPYVTFTFEIMSSGAPAPPALQPFAFHSVRVPRFAPHVTGTAQRAPAHGTMTSTEAKDVAAAVVHNTIGGTLTATEPNDVAAFSVPVVTVPVTYDNSERIYVIQENVTLRVPADPVRSPFVIPSEGTMAALPFTDR